MFAAWWYVKQQLLSVVSQPLRPRQSGGQDSPGAVRLRHGVDATDVARHFSIASSFALRVEKREIFGQVGAVTTV